MKKEMITNVFAHPVYTRVTGYIIAETDTHLLIDATCGGHKMVEANLKYIVRKDNGYWIKIGWDHPMNDTRNYEAGYDIIQLFQRQFGQPAEFYFYTFYGRIDEERERLESIENPKILKEILPKRFSSKSEMKDFLVPYLNEIFSFKDIGINNTHGGGIVSAHSIRDLYNAI